MKVIEISNIIIHNPEINCFDDLLEAVRGITSDEVLFLDFDIKPDYRDTPRDWQSQLEAVFAGGAR